jgi:tetratricopeptide (TPR) repeat protein
VFKEAQDEEQLKSWEDDQGREILSYFLGREALFLSRDEIEFLDDAEAAFKEALEINPDYVRGHIGLGGVYFQRAQQLSPAERLDDDNLNLAIAEYTQAMEEGATMPGSQVEVKGLLALGKAYRLLGEAYLHSGANDEAIPAYNQAIEHIEQAIGLLSADQHRLLAEAYFGLAIAYHGRAHIEFVADKVAGKPLFEKALAAYDNCIREAEAEFYDTTLQDVKNNYCLPNRAEVQKVLADF